MAPPPPLLLIPPSEAKAPGGTGPAWTAGTIFAPELDRRRVAALTALRVAMRGSAASRATLLGVKGTALAEATETNRMAAEAPTRAAIERYSGVLYGALDHRTLPAAHRRRLDRQVRILSGLWGVVAPPDPITDYKVKMGARLGRLGRLSTWWRPAVTAALAPEIGGRVVWDLLPNEHRAAWSPDLGGGDASPTAVISVRFADAVPRGDTTTLVTVAHWNKLLKGALVRHVLAAQLGEVAGLAEFAHPLGYRYDPDLTEVADDGIRVTATLVKR